MFKASLLALLVSIIPTAALATNVSGTLATHTTWTSAGNPWVMTGDVTVPAGVTLTINPGVQVTFASTDSTGSGSSTSQVELIVNGTLNAQGTTSSPITLTATNAYGVRVLGGATATFNSVNLSGGTYGIDSFGATTFTNSTVQGPGSATCVRVGNGTLSFSNGTIQNCPRAVNAIGGSVSLSYSVVRSSGYFGNGYYALTFSGPTTLIHNTLTGNIYGAVKINSFTGTVNIYDNIITSNGLYGISFSSTTLPTRAVHHNDVWGHESADYTRVTEGTGSISSNPLFVSSSNFHITEYSPARLTASDGTDLGAFAYAGDPATSLQGALVADKTLTGANTLAGDLTVRPGVTLTLASGASLTFASTDGMGSGTEPTKVELFVEGTLNAQGTSASPVTVTATNGVGVRVQGSATFDYTTIQGGSACLTVNSGTASFTHGLIQNCAFGLYTFGGTTTLAYSVVRNSGSSANTYYAVTVSAPTNLIHNTLTGNPYGAIKVYSFTGNVNIYDNIISSDGRYGITFSTTTSPTRAVHHNDVWSHSSSNYAGVTAGIGSFSANPLFVSSSNFHITEYSPARLTASDGTDLGAFAYAGDATPSLQGALVADKTLTGANTLAGDLTVRPGATLTLASGATLTFGSSDGMASGSDTTKIELTVDGNLNVPGTSASPVTINATNGVGTNITGSATFSYATLDGGRECLRVTSGTTAFTHGTLQNCTLALNTLGGSTDFTSSVVRNSGSSSNSFYAVEISAPTNLIHDTLTANNYGAIKVYNFTGTANIYDNIVSSNGLYGISFLNTASPTRAVHHNDVWTHSSSDYSGVTPGAGSISSNPLFVSSTNLTLQETSPCRNTASDGTDMGALPYVPVHVSYIVVTPTTATLAVQGTRQFSATAYDSSNNPLPSAITWSAASAAGSVSSSGLFTAGCAPGTYTAAVTASADGKSASAEVTLTVGAAAAVAVSPSSASMPIHGAQQFTASVTDACNNSLPTAPTTWAVTSGGGSINSTGLFTAGTTPGTFTNTVKASSGALFGTASVTVTGGALASIQVTPNAATLSINGTQQFTATGRDSAGNIVPATLTWSVTNGGGSIDSSGLFTAGSIPGTFNNAIKATSGAISGLATITVQAGALASIDVTPDPVTLPINGTQQYTATGRDSAGNIVPATVTWSVVNGGGSINSTGLFTASTVAGTFSQTVKASSGPMSATASVTVNAGALQTVTVAPTSVTLSVGSEQQFTAQGQDADGNAVPITPVWSVVSGAGSITQDGLFTATQTPGSYLHSIVATANGVTGTASVTVAVGGIQRVVLSPQNPTVAVNGTITFTAKAFDAFDNELTGLTTTWEAVAGGTIDASGVFTAGTLSGTFVNAIKVTVGDKSATTSVTPSTDVDGDGMPDAWEIANGLDPTQPGDATLDPDGDTLSNLSEFQTGTAAHDADTDDDGVLDGDEQNPGQDADGDGLVNARDPDSDNDGLFDGTEMAVSTPHADTDTSQGRFIADVDPTTSTASLIADTDGDGHKDGKEDANHNGKTDLGETDSNHAETLCSATPKCGSGQVCEAGVCVAGPSGLGDGGGGCNSSGAGASMLGLVLISLLGRVGARRRTA